MLQYLPIQFVNFINQEMVLLRAAIVVAIFSDDSCGNKM
jgi:hypothetical protein